MKKHILLASLLIGVVAVIAITGQKNDTPLSVGTIEAFNDAYPAEIEETGEIVEYPITAMESPIELPSGTITNSWTYNGATPGPEIRLNLGDTLRIPFINNLPDETTIHFHGIRVPNAMDGVPGVTQDPVQPGGEFVYEFIPKDPGTYWFHPHVRGSEQLERGLYGTIIVEDEYAQSLDQDHVIVLDDWRLSDANTIHEVFNHPHDVSHDGRWGNITVNSKAFEELTVSPGQRVRLRFVNAANGRVFQPVFSQPVEIVAVDGMSLESPIPYSPMEVSPGNRLDVEFTATEDMSMAVTDTFFGKNNPLLSVAASGDEIESRTISYPNNIHIPDWGNDAVLVKDPDIEYVLDAGGNGMGMMAFNWTINDELYGSDVPQIAAEGELIKVRFRNDSLRFHPMHLHGQFFKVIARDGKSVDEPYWHDTVLVRGTETIDVMMYPLDVGQWAMHCHIQEHAEAGMMTTLIIE